LSPPFHGGGGGACGPQWPYGLCRREFSVPGRASEAGQAVREISSSFLMTSLLILSSLTGYTRLDKIRSEVIRKELEISGIQDVRLKYNQNWINHLERMDNTRLPKHALNYKPRGRRDHGRTRKWWKWVDAGTGQTTYSMEEDDDDDDKYILLSSNQDVACRYLMYKTSFK